jgi:hypothetical protein
MFSYSDARRLFGTNRFCVRRASVLKNQCGSCWRISSQMLPPADGREAGPFVREYLQLISR